MTNKKLNTTTKINCGPACCTLFVFAGAIAVMYVAVTMFLAFREQTTGNPLPVSGMVTNEKVNVYTSEDSDGDRSEVRQYLLEVNTEAGPEWFIVPKSVHDDVRVGYTIEFTATGKQGTLLGSPLWRYAHDVVITSAG